MGMEPNEGHTWQRRVQPVCPGTACNETGYTARGQLNCAHKGQREIFIESRAKQMNDTHHDRQIEHMLHTSGLPNAGMYGIVRCMRTTRAYRRGSGMLSTNGLRHNGFDQKVDL